MLKLVVFDWNGCIIADTLTCMAADNHILKKFGGKPVDLRAYRETIVIPAVDFYERNGCDRAYMLAHTSEIAKEFSKAYAVHAKYLRSRNGARAALGFLKSHSIDSVILSNHMVSDITGHLKRLRLADYFSQVLANPDLDTAMHSRNKSGKMKKLLSEMGLDPRMVCIVGDSPEEVEIGKSVGVWTISVAGGYYSEARLKATKPDFLIHSLTELPQVIKEINRRRV